MPDGSQTDFHKAVAAREGEKIVFSRQIWPSRKSLDAAEEKMHADRVVDTSEEFRSMPKG